MTCCACPCLDRKRKRISSGGKDAFQISWDRSVLILPLDSRNLLVTKTHIPMFCKGDVQDGKRGAKACCNHCSNERRDGSDTVCKEISGQIFDCRNCRRACGYFCSRTCSSRAKTCICCIFFLFTERVLIK